jgi:hypothetical protein
MHLFNLKVESAIGIIITFCSASVCEGGAKLQVIKEIMYK